MEQTTTLQQEQPTSTQQLPPAEPTLTEKLRGYTAEILQRKPELTATTHNFLRTGARFAYRLFGGAIDAVASGIRDAQDDIREARQTRKQLPPPQDQ